jgi:3-oxoacyl-[acyl-carrier-protein] synthase II
LLKYLPNMLACHVTIIHGAQGPSNTITCNEASGLLSVGESRSVIRRGAADACFSGSAESKVNLMGFLRHQLLGRLAETGESAGAAGVLAPYSGDAKGTVLGEVGGLVVLEAIECATERGARMYANVLGFGGGQSPAGDDPSSRSEGLATAISSALADAGVSAGEIDAIVPHASSHAETDAEERHALERVFGDGLRSVPLITLPPAIGEGMAGAGGAAICAAAMCMQRQHLPARLNVSTSTGGVLAGPSEGCDATLRRVLVCTNAIGGQNAAVVLGQSDVNT